MLSRYQLKLNTRWKIFARTYNTKVNQNYFSIFGHERICKEVLEPLFHVLLGKSMYKVRSVKFLLDNYMVEPNSLHCIKY